MKPRRFAALLAVGTALILGLGILAVPAAVTARADASDPVIAAAGNIACDPNNPNFHALTGTKTGCRMKYVSDLLVGPNATPKYGTVLALGDTQYICGGLAGYNQSYDPTWGRVYQVTKPVVGDKDYRSTANAATGTGCSAPPGRAEGFFSYFSGLPFIQKGTSTGSGAYYSFNVPSGCTPDGANPCWHFIAINGNCKKAPGCTPGTKQYDWVAADLAANPNSTYGCTVAFWHQPRFSSGAHGSDAAYDALWRLLYQRGVDIVLNAHEHVYERFAPQNPDAVADPVNGIRQFTVGTGGVSHAKFPSANRAANSQVSNDATFGVLTLTLHLHAYDWSFIPEAGKTFSDASSTSTTCH